MKQKIFLIHNHKDFSGAARSLGELIESLKKKIDFYIICPKGTSSLYFKKIIPNVLEAKIIPRFNHFELGHYQGIRWLLIFRELLAFIYFIYFIIKIKIKFNSIKQFHLNELELITCAPLIKILFKSKISSHIRCPIETKRGYIRKKILKFLCNKFLDKLIAIDKDCYFTSPDKPKTIIIYNGINKKNLKVKLKKKIYLTFGFIGNFLKRKGIYDLLKVFYSLEKKGISVKLICVGNPSKKNIIAELFKIKINFENFLKVNKINQCKNIIISPMTFNINNFYSSIDVLVFPSYMNAVGRPVIEASLLKKPSIIGLNRYNSDTAIKGGSLIFKPGNLIALKKQILFLYKNRQKVKKMGLKAYLNANTKFNLKVNSMKFYNIFKR